MPVAWRVLEHGSSSVSFVTYKDLLTKVAARRAYVGQNRTACQPGIGRWAIGALCQRDFGMALSPATQIQLLALATGRHAGCT